MKPIQQKLTEIFQLTINENNDLFYNGDLNEIDHYKLFCKAGLKKAVFKVMGCNTCMLNTKFNDKKAVVMIFSIPVNNETGNKVIADRVIEVIKHLEECFITLDFVNSIENKEDNFVYITIIKNVENEQCAENELDLLEI